VAVVSSWCRRGSSLLSISAFLGVLGGFSDFAILLATEAKSIIAMRWDFATTIFGRAPLWQDDMMIYWRLKGKKGENYLVREK